MYAIIKTGGKQYRVQEGDSILSKNWKTMLILPSYLMKYWQ